MLFAGVRSCLCVLCVVFVVFVVVVWWLYSFCGVLLLLPLFVFVASVGVLFDCFSFARLWFVSLVCCLCLLFVLDHGHVSIQPLVPESPSGPISPHSCACQHHGFSVPRPQNLRWHVQEGSNSSDRPGGIVRLGAHPGDP
jgi:energy-coupling factor transporter transmembrane protein EcfT